MPIAKHRADLAELISIAALQRKRINQRHRRHHSVFHIHEDSLANKFNNYSKKKNPEYVPASEALSADVAEAQAATAAAAAGVVAPSSCLAPSLPDSPSLSSPLALVPLSSSLVPEPGGASSPPPSPLHTNPHPPPSVARFRTCPTSSWTPTRTSSSSSPPRCDGSLSCCPSVSCDSSSSSWPSSLSPWRPPSTSLPPPTHHLTTLVLTHSTMSSSSLTN
jgi:hypothetical protein